MILVHTCIYIYTFFFGQNPSKYAIIVHNYLMPEMSPKENAKGIKYAL